MVFNAIFNNILVISWQSVVLVEKTGVSGENNRPVATHLHTLSHNVASSTPRHERGLKSQLYSKIIAKTTFTDLLIYKNGNRIGGVLVGVFASNVVDCEFEPQSGQTNDYEVCICCLPSTEH
jgi:hypothetical protein